jgi:UDP-glucuronate decarboxylase
MKKILVAGGAGFIGFHLCNFLLNQGDEVVVIDNLQTSNPDNIKKLLLNQNFTFIEQSIIDPLNLDIKFDQIYNLACPASPIHYQKDPIGTIKVNTVGVMNLLELAKEQKARILQTSTSEVYGDPSCHPQVEEYRGNVNPIGPRACYDEGKRVAETLFFEYHRQFAVEIRVARLFNTYGPNMDRNDGRVVSNFITQALEGRDITIYGDGSQTRSFCFVSDTVRGLYALMNQDEFIGPVNIGNPDEKDMVEIAQEIISLTKSSSKIIFESLPVDDPTKRCPDISLANKYLKWNPEIKLADGLKETINYFSQVVSN